MAQGVKDSLRKWLTLPVALGAATGGLMIFSAPAQAGTSWTHNNYYNYSALKSAPTYSSQEVWDEYNDQPVTMLCYVNGQYVTSRTYSNYDSGKWFRVRDAAGRVGYMHSSYVYYQTTVGYC